MEKIHIKISVLSLLVEKREITSMIIVLKIEMNHLKREKLMINIKIKALNLPA